MTKAEGLEYYIVFLMFVTYVFGLIVGVVLRPMMGDWDGVIVVPGLVFLFYMASARIKKVVKG